MAADYSRIHRLLKILALIQGQLGWTASRLANECGTTVRTVYRDLEMLEGAGVPYFFDKETNGYRIRADFFMPPVQLTVDEALALSALASQIGAQEQVPFLEAAGKAIHKIRAQFPPAIQQELDHIENHLAIKLAPANTGDSSADVYGMIRRALAITHVVECDYDSASVQLAEKLSPSFLLKPYALLFNQRAWYVLGFHAGRNEIRCLKLSRFKKVRLLEKKYVIPADFSLSDYLGNAWRFIRGKERFEVELNFDREFAETISETQWHRTQEVIWNSDGSIVFHCSIDGLDEIVWWILSMGPHCVVKRPKRLAQAVEELARGIVAKYARAKKGPKRRSAANRKSSKSVLFP